MPDHTTVRTTIRYNLHDYAIVRLTSYGELAWANDWLGVCAEGVPESNRRAQTEADGRVRFQIHEWMRVFGGMMYVGSTVAPFVDGEVEFRKAAG